jgi:colicin import membrane protein
MSMAILKCEDRSLPIIAAIVVACHLFLLTVSALAPTVKPKPLPPKQLVVKTIQLKPTPAKKEKVIAREEVAPPQPEPEPVIETIPEPIPEPILEPAPEPVIESKPKPKPEPKPTPKPKPKPKPKEKPTSKPKNEVKKKEEPKKKTPPKVEKPVKTETKPKPTPKPPKPKPNPEAEAAKARQKELQAQEKKRAEAAKAKQRDLVAKAKESVAKIQKSDHKSSQSSALATTLGAAVPGKIESLHIESLPDSPISKLSKHEVSYRDELASRLKLLLKLPEYGEVKLKLTLERTGKVSKVVIVNSKSNANRKYIEKTLPTLTFPNFGTNFENQTNYTFIISLSNDL